MSREKRRSSSSRLRQRNDTRSKGEGAALRRVGDAHMRVKARTNGARGVRFALMAILVLIATASLLLHASPLLGGVFVSKGLLGAQPAAAVPDVPSGGLSVSSTTPQLYTYAVIREFPHDPGAFTQGLVYYNASDAWFNPRVPKDGILYESTGLYGRTSVRALDPTTGAVLQKNVAGSEALTAASTAAHGRGHFGEGLALVPAEGGGDKEERDGTSDTGLDDSSSPKLLQLTWHSNIVFEYDARTLRSERMLRTELRDGWGLAGPIPGTVAGVDDVEAVLAATDSGTSIYYLDPRTMKTLREVTVRDGDVPVPWLNELEFVNGSLWGNVYQTQCIVIVDPMTGAVDGWIDMDGLRSRLKAEDQRMNAPDVLNGIAFDEGNDRLFLTGKLWSKMFEVKVLPVDTDSSGEQAKSIRKRCVPRAVPI